MNTGNWESAPMGPMGGYTSVEMLLDDVSNRMAATNFPRHSRGSNSQKTGGSIRVVKPSSASNSPRSSMGLARRRTVMNDGAYRRRVTMMDQTLMANGGFITNDGLPDVQQPRSTRPVSWHPASHLVPQQAYQSYATPTPELNNQYPLFNLPGTPSVYSGYASPDSTFSPLSMSYTGYEQPQYFQNTPTTFSTHHYTNQQEYVQESDGNLAPQTVANTDPSMYSHFDWNNFATNGFDAPPTPDNFLPIQHPEPSFPAEDSIPYHPLEDDESDDGEELIGMGLYDTPEITKSSSADPQLDNYRALMMSQLLGSGYVPPPKIEPTGKGLKLEETWTPPSDDEDEDDDEQDGEGEDEEQEVKVEASIDAAQTYCPAGWV
jgi:hypothetical protein